MKVPFQRVLRDVWTQMAELSFTARAVGVYLLTNSHGNALGYFWLPAGYAVTDLGLDESVVRDALRELEVAGRIAYDEATQMVLLLDHGRHDPPQNLNQAIHRCELWGEGALSAGPATLRARALRQLAKELNACLDKLAIKDESRDCGKRERVAETVSELLQDAQRLECNPSIEDSVDAGNSSATVPKPFGNGCETVRESRARAASTTTTTTTPTPSLSSPPTGGRGRRVELSAEATRLAELLATRIRANDPRAKLPLKFDAWAGELDCLHRLDSRPWTQIEEVINWCQSDQFWRSNILSAAKLRKQFTQLALKMVATTTAPAAGPAPEPLKLLPPLPPRQPRPSAPEVPL